MGYEREFYFDGSISNSDLDKQAKTLFSDILLNEKKFVEVSKNGGQSDLKATAKDGKVYYFELKATQKENYFGSASFTEWEKAFEFPDTYFFVVAYYHDGYFHFTEYSVEEFRQFTTIPPIKVFFNLNTKTGEGRTITNKSVRLTKDSFVLLNAAYMKLKK